MFQVRDLEERLIGERKEKAELAAERAALVARLASANENARVEAEEREALQAELIASEEGRLEVSSALLDFQMDHNRMKVSSLNPKWNSNLLPG